MTTISAADAAPQAGAESDATGGATDGPWGARPSAAVSVPASPPRPASPQSGRFHGSARAFFALLVRGSVLLMATLGIYRFWLATDVRRFLWGHTEIAADRLEYTGTPRELLVGFLMAIALVLPINGLLFVGTAVPGMLPFSGAAGFALLFLLGRFAIFRARRYRLTRTVFRGVRLHQTGSATAFAVVSTLWWIATVLTAGLVYPWQAASLERFKLRHTHYGDLGGAFAGSGTGLFIRGGALWLAVVGPTLFGLAWAVASLDWAALADALASEGDDTWAQIEASNPGLGAAFVLASLGVGWGVVAAALLYPVFRAIVLRWWVSGLRLGPMRAVSRLRTGQVYGVYMRFLGYAVAFALLAGVMGFVAGVALAFLGSAFAGSGAEIATVVLGLAAYVAVALGYSALFQSAVTLPLWRLSFETAEFSGLETLAGVAARGAPASPFGEGLADALDVGGI